jgi:hypothetical protein
MAMVNASRNYVYVDTKPVTGSLLTPGIVFPATGLGFTVPGGLRDFLVRDTLPASPQIPLSFAENLSANKSYTLFVYDTTTAPRQKTVETEIIVPTDNSARIRFASFVYSPTAIPTAFDIFSVKRNANIFTNVNLTDVTAFIPYQSNVTDTFYIRPTGTGTNLQNWSRNPQPAGTLVNIQLILTPLPKRSYTIVFRGGYRSSNIQNLTSPFAANPHVRTLSSFVNY